MRLIHLKGCIAEKRDDSGMVVRMFFRWPGKFLFENPEREFEISFKDKLIVSQGGYGFSLFADQLVITDDETDVVMPPFGRPYLAEMLYPESRAVFGLETHGDWVTGVGRKRTAEAAGFSMKDIQKMFPQ